MFEYIFPIFAFGLLVTGIVCKGLLTAADVEKADREAHERLAQITPPAIQPESRTAAAAVSKPAAAAA